MADEPAQGARKRRFCVALVLILGALYVGLHNGQYWTGSGDDAYYIAVARNLAQGEGYHWNGTPAVLAPPGWPAFLALAMKVSASFWFLPLVASALVLAAAACWYCVLLRFTSAERAFLVMLVVGVLFSWHRFAHVLNSEALFYPLSGAALLLALQIREGRPPWWRAAALLALCAALPLVRYTGLVMAPVLAGALVKGHVLPRWNRRWALAVLACIVLVVSFVLTRWGVHAYSVRFAEQAPTEVLRRLGLNAARYHERMAAEAFNRGPRAYLRRLSQAGACLSGLLWPPTIPSARSAALRLLRDLAGWGLIAMLAVATLEQVRKLEWTLAGALVFCFSLIVAHHRFVARYIAPMTPLLLAGIWAGFETAGGWLRRPVFGKAARVANAVFLASLVLCNGAILTAAVVMAQMPDSHEVVVGGEYAEVLRIARYLEARQVGHGELAFCFWHPRDRVTRVNNWTRRIVYLVTDRRIPNVPRRLTAHPPGPELLALAREHGARFVLMRPARFPRRLWHFVLPGQGGDDEGALRYYAFYEVREEGLVRVDPPPTETGLHAVPRL